MRPCRECGSAVPNSLDLCERCAAEDRSHADRGNVVCAKHAQTAAEQDGEKRPTPVPERICNGLLVAFWVGVMTFGGAMGLSKNMTSSLVATALAGVVTFVLVAISGIR